MEKNLLSLLLLMILFIFLQPLSGLSQANTEKNRQQILENMSSNKIWNKKNIYIGGPLKDYSEIKVCVDTFYAVAYSHSIDSLKNRFRWKGGMRRTTKITLSETFAADKLINWLDSTARVCDNNSNPDSIGKNLAISIQLGMYTDSFFIKNNIGANVRAERWGRITAFIIVYKIDNLKTFTGEINLTPRNKRKKEAPGNGEIVGVFDLGDLQP